MSKERIKYTSPVPTRNAHYVNKCTMITSRSKIYYLKVASTMSYNVNNIFDILSKIIESDLSDSDINEIVDVLKNNNKNINGDDFMGDGFNLHPDMIHTSLFSLISYMAFNNVNPNHFTNVIKIINKVCYNFDTNVVHKFMLMKYCIMINCNMIDEYKDLWIKKLNNLIVLA